VCSEEFMRAHHLENNAVEIIAQAMVTDLPSSFDLKNKRYKDQLPITISLLLIPCTTQLYKSLRVWIESSCLSTGLCRVRIESKGRGCIRGTFYLGGSD